MNNPPQDFAPLPTYTESSTSNATWVNVTVIRTDPDGSKSQVLAIAPKAK